MVECETDGGRVVPPGCTRAGALATLRAAFAAAGLDTPGLDARILARAALDLDDVALLTRSETALDHNEADRLDGFARRRLAREPVARILGRAEFWGLPFELGPATLVPRPDTETLVAEAIASLATGSAGPRIADLGTGSGCILLAILHERSDATGIGVDRSEPALAIASRNAAVLGLSPRVVFAASDWTSALRGPFDCVVSNPPYIPDGEIPSLEPDVAWFDPVAALAGGPDGLDAYRAILADAGRILAADGTLLLEIGHDQHAALLALAPAYGFSVSRTARDLAGHVRVLALARAGSAREADREMAC